MALRRASTSEDPGKRRINGGGKTRYVVQLIALTYPEIAMTSIRPAVTHSADFTLVTAAKPAAAGEILSVFVRGPWSHATRSRIPVSRSRQRHRRSIRRLV